LRSSFACPNLTALTHTRIIFTSSCSFPSLHVEYLNLYSNQFTGTIPNNLRFRKTIFADFGRNQFTGTLPDDIGSRWISIRFLYMDHNKFTGTIPYSYPSTGNARLEYLALNHNQLTGWVPDDWGDNRKLRKCILSCFVFSKEEELL
jgi:hypothetical protein